MLVPPSLFQILKQDLLRRDFKSGIIPSVVVVVVLAEMMIVLLLLFGVSVCV